MSDKPTRESMRAQFPEIAELVDSLRGAGFDPRVLCILDHDGNALVGKQPPPEIVAPLVEAARTPRTPAEIPPAPIEANRYRGRNR